MRTHLTPLPRPMVQPLVQPSATPVRFSQPTQVTQTPVRFEGWLDKLLRRNQTPSEPTNQPSQPNPPARSAGDLHRQNERNLQTALNFMLTEDVDGFNRFKTELDLQGIKLDLSNIDLNNGVASIDLKFTEFGEPVNQTKPPLNLSGINLRGVNLTSANMRDVILVDADLSETNLLWASLEGANLARANLSDARCHFTDFNGANLAAANLSRTQFKNVNFAPVERQVVTPLGLWVQQQPTRFSTETVFHETTRDGQPFAPQADHQFTLAGIEKLESEENETQPKEPA